MLTDVNFMTKRVGHQIYRCCRHLSALPSQPPPPLPRVVVETEELVVHSLPVTPLDMNQYLLGCKQKKKAVLIDCGCEWPDRWVRTAAQVLGLLLLTLTFVLHSASIPIHYSSLRTCNMYWTEWHDHHSSPADTRSRGSHLWLASHQGAAAWGAHIRPSGRLVHL